jgi:hypothetical protein
MMRTKKRKGSIVTRKLLISMALAGTLSAFESTNIQWLYCRDSDADVGTSVFQAMLKYRF